MRTTNSALADEVMSPSNQHRVYQGLLNYVRFMGGMWAIYSTITLLTGPCSLPNISCMANVKENLWDYLNHPKMHLISLPPYFLTPRRGAQHWSHWTTMVGRVDTRKWTTPTTIVLITNVSIGFTLNLCVCASCPPTDKETRTQTPISWEFEGKGPNIFLMHSLRTYFIKESVL